MLDVGNVEPGAAERPCQNLSRARYGPMNKRTRLLSSKINTGLIFHLTWTAEKQERAKRIRGFACRLVTKVTGTIAGRPPETPMLYFARWPRTQA